MTVLSLLRAVRPTNLACFLKSHEPVKQVIGKQQQQIRTINTSNIEVNYKIVCKLMTQKQNYNFNVN
jgi:hypothetical protein